MARRKTDGPKFSYDKWFSMYQATEPASVSEKVIGTAVGVSERQIRNARQTGEMDEFLADSLCQRLLDLHPCEVYGYDAWFGTASIPDDFEDWHKKWLAGEAEPEVETTKPRRTRTTRLLSEEDVIEVRRLLAEGLTQQKVADQFGVSRSAIAHISAGRNWK